MSVRRSFSQPAALSCKSLVQGRLALSTRYCRLRMRDPANSGDRYLLPIQRLRTDQLRRALHGAPVPASTGVSQRILSAENQQDHQRRNDEFDADAVPFLPRFLLQELIFGHCPHLADPDHSQLLIAWCWQMDLFCDVECTSHLFATVTFTSANTAAFWLRKQQQQLSYVGDD